MVRFLAIGDWGRKGSVPQQKVAKAMSRVAEREQIHFVVSTGDNFYEDGVRDLSDPHWQQSFRQVYRHPALQCPWYLTLGNHDHRGRVDMQIAYAAQDARWILPARYYTRCWPTARYPLLQLFFLDTTPFISNYYPGGSEVVEGIEAYDPEAQRRWLEQALVASKALWKIVVGHHPLASGSPFHGSYPELKHALGPLLFQHGVQVYLCGHEHDLQHLYLPDGLHCVVSGSGADVRETGWMAYTRFAAARLGFAGFELDRQALQVSFYDETGEAFYTQTVEQATRMTAMV